MKIQIEEIRKEFEEKFPVQNITSGYEIDKDQLLYFEEMMFWTHGTIKEKVFSETFNMFDFKTFINDCKAPEDKLYVAMLSEFVTEKALCIFLMNPEYFEQHFGSSLWFNDLHKQYHEEFFGDENTQYRSRDWYLKLRPEVKNQLSLFGIGKALH